jgi:hypothetical protein
MVLRIEFVAKKSVIPEKDDGEVAELPLIKLCVPRNDKLGRKTCDLQNPADTEIIGVELISTLQDNNSD